MTNTNDSGMGSLRQAILDANAATGDDTINFSLSSCPCVINLTGGKLSIANKGKLTISGLGANQLSVSGSKLSRVFFIQENATAAISDLTVTGGGDAAGILNQGGTLTLTKVTISNNYSTSVGGGIYNTYNGTVTLNNSTVSGNAVGGDGGGIANFGSTLTLINSTVSNNSVGISGGGGIYTTFLIIRQQLMSLTPSSRETSLVIIMVMMSLAFLARKATT